MVLLLKDTAEEQLVCGAKAVYLSSAQSTCIAKHSMPSPNRSQTVKQLGGSHVFSLAVLAFCRLWVMLGSEREN